MALVILDTFFVSFSVIFNEAPSGRDIDAKITPWSSSGTRELGIIRAILTVAPRKSRNIIHTINARLRKKRTPAEYAFVIESKNELNHLNRKNLLFSLCGFRISEHIAGVSVRATKPEITTDVAIVMANCL